MSKTKFEISLEKLSSIELSNLISNEEVSGNRALQVKREINLRQEIANNSSESLKKIPKKIWNPKLFG